MLDLHIFSILPLLNWMSLTYHVDTFSNLPSYFQTRPFFHYKTVYLTVSSASPWAALRWYFDTIHNNSSASEWAPHSIPTTCLWLRDWVPYHWFPWAWLYWDVDFLLDHRDNVRVWPSLFPKIRFCFSVFSSRLRPTQYYSRNCLSFKL